MADPNHDPADPVQALDDEIGPRDLHRFVTVLRGYDRIEVDECLRRIAATVAELRSRPAAGSPRAEPPPAPEPPAPEPPTPEPPTEPGEGFGVRAERLLRLADTEAREIRTAAARERTTILEEARADAERIRHEREQELIARSAQLEQETAARMSELQQREQQVAEQMAEIRRETDAARADARREVAALHEQARREIARARAEAAAEIDRRQAEAAEGLERLRRLDAAARVELQRLVDLVGEQIGALPQGRPAAVRPSPDRAS